MKALGELAGPDDVAGLVAGVLAAQAGKERAAAEKAVMFACVRLPNSAESLLTAINRLGDDDQLAMLSTLGRVGGAGARAKIESALTSRDGTRHAQGMRALANWPDASIAPRLIELATRDPHPGHRITALRSLIRVAPLPDDRTDLERLELLRQAMAMCERDQDRLLVLQRAQAIRIPETLRFLLPYLDEPYAAAEACQSIVELAHHRGLREPHKAEFDAALDRVIQTSKDPTVVDRARRYQKNQTWARPAEPARR